MWITPNVSSPHLLCVCAVCQQLQLKMSKYPSCVCVPVSGCCVLPSLFGSSVYWMWVKNPTLHNNGLFAVGGVSIGVGLMFIMFLWRSDLASSAPSSLSALSQTVQRWTVSSCLMSIVLTTLKVLGSAWIIVVYSGYRNAGFFLVLLWGISRHANAVAEWLPGNSCVSAGISINCQNTKHYNSYVIVLSREACQKIIIIISCQNETEI